MEEYPKIRAIEPILLKVEGEPMIAVRDPRGLGEQTMLLSPPMFYLAMLMTGRRSMADIQDQFHEAAGLRLSLDEIGDLVRHLDENYLLDNERARRRSEELEAAYRREPVRRPACEGNTYPSHVDALRALLDSCLEQARGEPSDEVARPPRAVLVPHIAYERGQRCYGLSYDHLRRWDEPVTFVILGSGHNGVVGTISATRKHFATALGRVETDQGFLDRLAADSPIGTGRDELSHREEHSIELQTVFLQHVLGGVVPFTIVPILVGSFEPYMQAGRMPMEDADYAGFVAALGRVIDRHDRPVCLVGAVDLAHIGPRFGDDFEIDEPRLTDLRRRDLDTLERIVAGDAVAFFDEIAREQDDRRMCGFPPIFTLLSITGPMSGKLLGYDQSVDESGSVVSVCSAVFA